MKQEFLEAEIRLLLLKYGSDAVIRSLALIKGVSVEDLRSSISRLEEKKPDRPKRRVATAEEIVNNMHIESPEKAAVLRALAVRFDNRTFLRDLRDIRSLLDRSRIEVRSLKSRQDAARKVFDHLAHLPLIDLRNMEEDRPAQTESAFSELANEIMGVHGKKLSPLG